MISFQPTDDETAFINVAKSLAVEKIQPLARNSEDSRLIDPSLIDEVKDLGFLSLELPEAFGGIELPLLSQVQIMQALTYGDLGIVQGLPGAGDATSLLRMNSESNVFDSYKNDLTSGGQGTVAFIDMTDTDEPLGSEVSITHNDGNYVLHGTSEPVRLAQFADYVAISAVDSTGEAVIFWLDKQAGHEWEVEEGDYRLGLIAAGIARITFDKLSVSSDHVVASGEEAAKLTTQLQTRMYILQAANEVGLMETTVDYVTEYTAGRKAFGKEIAKFQAVSFRVATMAIETRSANLLVWKAATKADEHHKKAWGLSLRALYRAHRSLRFVTDSAVQLLGGHGYVQDYPVEKWMRDAQAQVALYGRERDLLSDYGKQILSAQEEVASL